MRTDLDSRDPVIVAYRRTPFGRAQKGSFATERPENLSAAAVKATLDALPEDAVPLLADSYFGCAVPQGTQGDNIGRRVNIMLGLNNLPAVTVNRFCSSSLQTAAMAAQAIRAGDGEAYLVAGIESTSSAPPVVSDPHPVFADSAARADKLFSSGAMWEDPALSGLLPDIYIAMGKTAEFVARLTNTSRQEQDAWAYESQRRTEAAKEAGLFDAEIIPVHTTSGKTVHRDDCPRPGTTIEGLSQLQPVFHEAGTVTAGNASPLNDGASALVMMSAESAHRSGATPLARVLGSSASALSPEVMGLGPVEASQRLLKRLNLSVADIDVVELNEAFAAQVVPVVKALAIDPSRVNPLGGAIAIGHPFGATGVRLIGSAMNALRHTDGTLALATLCVGGGQGMALVLERLV